MDKVHFKQGDYVEKLCSCKISTLLGTDSRFRNVGKSQSDAGEIPKRIHTISTLVFINMKHTLRIIIDSPS
jgi:hypothetical protein